MSRELMECEAQALQLPPPQRATLAKHLIASLDKIDDAQNEELWLEEADRRYQEYKKGSISARSADDVIRDARTAIK
jgi:putative addiction module component (TIGR02574 family)